MEHNNPIKYSDLIAPDNSIELLISQLKEAQGAYAEMVRDIRKEAEKLREALKGMPSGVPEADETARTAREIDRLARAEKELAYAQSENGRELQRLNQLKNEENRISRLQEQVNKSAEGSYNRLSAQYSLNKIRLNQMSKAMRENTEEGKALEKQTREIYEEMNRLQVATGKHTLNVGNYASAFGGLGFATQQLVRELPSLTISANQFFLAISNNIPILVDQINLLRRANEAARAENKPTTNIIKGIVGSLLSWQTALVIGITLLSQHGGKIVEWVKKLFNGKEALDITAEAAKNFNKAMQQGAVDAVSETTKLDLLYNAATNSALSMERRREAAQELQRMYPDYLGNMSAEQIMLGQAVEKYQELTTAIIKYAEAKAAENQIIENATAMQKISNIQDIESLRNLRTEMSELNRQAGKMREDLKSIGVDPMLDKGYRDLISRLSEYRDISKDIVKTLELPKEYKNDVLAYYDTLEATNSKLAEIAQQGIGANPSGGGLSTQATTAKSNWRDYIPTVDLKAIEERNKRRIELERKAQDEELKFIDDEWERRRLQTNYQYEREIEDLQNYLDRNEDLTVHERERINARILLLSVDQGRALAKLTEEQSVWELEQQQKGIDLRLRAVEEGSEAEYKLLVERNRVALQLALAKNALLAEAERQSVEDIKAIYDKELADIIAKFASAAQKNIESAFNTAKDAVSQFSKSAGETFETLRKLFTTEWKDGKSLASILGIDDDATKDLNSMLIVGGSVVSMLQEITAERIKAADVAVQSAERETDAARDALQAELTARNEGYAHNVAQARKELELARRTEKQALAERQRAQRQQEAIDTATQAINLATAGALIWKQLGFPWAIPAIGAMFASFAATKIMAARASRETYGDGTVELLHGGSHQSGNDIDLGTKPDGTRRRAEGGEYFAVFNKRASRNRGALITDVVNSLNNGTFAQKYQRAYDMGGGIMLNVGGSSPDLRRLSDDVRKIKEQNERRTYLDGEGNVVEVYKNVKRVIKKC